MAPRKKRLYAVAALCLMLLAIAGWTLRNVTSRPNRLSYVTPQMEQQLIAGAAAAMRRFDRDKADVAAIFADAVRVEAIRLSALQEHQKSGSLSGFPIVGRGTAQGKEFAQELGDVVLDGRTYGEPGRSITLCWFMPDVAFRVVDSRGRKADVLITIQCRNLIVVEDNTKIPLQSFCGSGEDQWRFRVGGDFTGPSSPHMVQVTPQPERDPAKRIFTLIRTAFPDDGKLQEIVDKFDNK